MSLIYKKSSSRALTLENRAEPELYRELFPYTQIGRVEFNGAIQAPLPAEKMYITDTTFRDGQQARPPYSVKQIARMFDLLHKLGGKTGLINATEFFMYSEKDRKAIEICRSRGYRFPRITGWIRATKDDLRLAHDMEFPEVGMLTSVSDYHIYQKLGKDREKAMNDYLALVAQALEWGIVPRCHFEDITRADIYGFCLPFAQKLMELSKEASMPVKIRLCDTMGFAVPYPGATLPRSVQGIVRAFIEEANVPGDWLEWHGHNDFHKSLVNGVTAWLYGCGNVNGALLGFGERTGNTPVEALVMEYISLTAEDNAADTTVIAEIGEFFEKELEYVIPPNYPFVGSEFNATSAGVHVDGLAKNEEIYNIFDTTAILGKSVPIIITDKSGRAGVAYWLNQHLKLSGEMEVTKKHPAVGQIYDEIMKVYDTGRNTSFSSKEMEALARQYMPELFVSELERIQRYAGKKAGELLVKLTQKLPAKDDVAASEMLEKTISEYPFIQYLYIIDTKGHLSASAYTHENPYNDQYAAINADEDYTSRVWFKNPLKTGKLHITPVYQSHYTEKLVFTVSQVITDDNDNIVSIIGADIQIETLLNHAHIFKMEDE